MRSDVCSLYLHSPLVLCVCVSVSVLRRSTMGASRALHALLIEEQQEHVRLARRFSGDAYRLSDGKKVKLPIAAPAVSASVNQVVVNQKYPGVDGSKFVVVPFLLLGSINFKTGAVRLEKVHIRYVFNNITYRGQVRVVGPDMNGQHEELKYDALMRQLEASSSQSQPVWTQKHKLCFDLSSESSHASLLLNADVAIVPLPDSQHELSASTKLKNSLSRPPEQPKQQPLSDDLARFSPSSTSRFKRSRNSSEAHSQSQPTTNTERSPKRHRIASVSPSQPIGNPLPIAGHVGFGVDLVSVAAASAERAPMDENL